MGQGVGDLVNRRRQLPSQALEGVDYLDEVTEIDPGLVSWRRPYRRQVIERPQRCRRRSSRCAGSVPLDHDHPR
jgi:hypothetical protein